MGGCGLQTAGLAFGGSDPSSPTTATELYNGTAWTNIANMVVQEERFGSCGTRAAALAFGGNANNDKSVVTQELNQFGPSTETIITT